MYVKRMWIPVSVLILSWAALITLSCSNGTDLFGEYRGVNLIEGYGFDYDGWTADWSESYYMNFEAVTAADAGGTTGLPDGAAVYRLEIPNLMPDGDFEATTVPNPPDNWTPGGVGTVVTAATGISGTTMVYDCPDKTDKINFSLSNLADSFNAGSFYTIRFDFIVGSALFDYHNGTNTQLPVYWEIAGLSGIQPFPTAEIDSEILAVSGGTFSINTPSDIASIVQSGKIDNFRVIRTDIPYAIRLEVPSIREGKPELIPGTYRFSVYVKQEESASVTPAVLNRFRSTGVTLQVEGPYASHSDTSAAAAFHPDDENADWSSWQAISVDINDLYPSAKEEPDNVVVLSVYPHDVNDEDIGSILIAAPSLEFIPEGSSN